MKDRRKKRRQGKALLVATSGLVVGQVACGETSETMDLVDAGGHVYDATSGDATPVDTGLFVLVDAGVAPIDAETFDSGPGPVVDAGLFIGDAGISDGFLGTDVWQPDADGDGDDDAGAGHD